MSTVPFAIYNGAGNELTSGLSEHEYAAAAQRFANDLGEAVEVCQGSKLVATYEPTAIKINVYRHVTQGGSWCFATWIDGEYDTSDALDVDDNASEAEALECARLMPMVAIGKRTVVRVEDC